MSMATKELEQTKRCRKCGETRPVSEFYTEPRHRDGLFSWCKGCAVKAACERQALHPEKVKRTRYNISFNEMWAKQGGLCASCGVALLPKGREPSSVTVDHDHNCCPPQRSCGNCVRGLICRQCNQVLGHAGDDERLLQRAAMYLARWKESLT